MPDDVPAALTDRLVRMLRAARGGCVTWQAIAWVIFADRERPRDPEEAVRSLAFRAGVQGHPIRTHPPIGYSLAA